MLEYKSYASEWYLTVILKSQEELILASLKRHVGCYPRDKDSEQSIRLPNSEIGSIIKIKSGM